MKKSEFQVLKKNLESLKCKAETYLRLCRELESINKKALKTYTGLIAELGQSCEQSSIRLVEIFTGKVKDSSMVFKNISKWSGVFSGDLKSLETCDCRLKYEEGLCDKYVKNGTPACQVLPGLILQATSIVKSEGEKLNSHVEEFSKECWVVVGSRKSTGINDTLSTEINSVISSKTQKPSFGKVTVHSSRMSHDSSCGNLSFGNSVSTHNSFQSVNLKRCNSSSSRS